MEAPAVGAAAEAPVVGVAAKAKEVQPEPSLASDAAGGTSDKDASESETEDKAGAGEVEDEEEDLFVSSTEDDGGDEGAEGAKDTPADMD